jgi:hypothetical protein
MEAVEHISKVLWILYSMVDNIVQKRLPPGHYGRQLILTNAHVDLNNIIQKLWEETNLGSSYVGMDFGNDLMKLNNSVADLLNGNLHYWEEEIAMVCLEKIEMLLQR